MSLQLIVDSLESVPETLRNQYAQDGDKYRLQLDDYEDAASLKVSLTRVNNESAARRVALDGWKSLGKTPEEIQALLDSQTQTERDKLAKGGEWDKLKNQILDQHKTELSKKDDSVNKMRGNLERYLVDAQAVAAISELKGVPALLLPHVKAAVKVIEDGDQFVTRVVDSNGNPRVNGKGEFLSIKDLVGEMRSSDVYGRAFEPTGSTGSGANSGGTSGGANTMSQASFDALRPAQRAAAMAKGVRLV